jgi:hypothetical protein
MSPWLPFIWETSVDELARLKHLYHLDEVAGHGQTEWDQILRIRHWVHRQWTHDGDHMSEHQDAFSLLEGAATGACYSCCEYAALFIQCCSALGFPARLIHARRADAGESMSAQGHVVAEVWFETRQRWVVMDVQWDAHWEEDGIPLDALSLRRITRQAKHATWILPKTETRPSPSFWLQYFHTILYLQRNDFFQSLWAGRYTIALWLQPLDPSEEPVTQFQGKSEPLPRVFTREHSAINLRPNVIYTW